MYKIGRQDFDGAEPQRGKRPVLLGPVAIDWGNVLSCSASAATPGALAALQLLADADASAIRSRARVLGVEAAVLARYIKVSSWPAANAVYALCGPTGLSDFLRAIECEDLEEIARTIVAQVTSELPLFGLLAGRCSPDRGVSDHQILEAVLDILRWIAAAQRGNALGRADRVLKRLRRTVKAAFKGGRSSTLLSELLSLHPVTFVQLRAAAQAGGHRPLRAQPIDLQALQVCIDHALAVPAATRQRRFLQGELRGLRAQLQALKALEPLDFVDHWIALGSGVTGWLVSIADQNGVCLWVTDQWDEAALLSSIDLAIDEARPQPGRPTDVRRLHLFKSLGMIFWNISGKLPSINADMTTPAGLFVADVLKLQPAPAHGDCFVHFSKKLAHAAFREAFAGLK